MARATAATGELGEEGKLFPSSLYTHPPPNPLSLPSFSVPRSQLKGTRYNSSLRFWIGSGFLSDADEIPKSGFGLSSQDLILLGINSFTFCFHFHKNFNLKEKMIPKVLLSLLFLEKQFFGNPNWSLNFLNIHFAKNMN